MFREYFRRGAHDSTPADVFLVSKQTIPLNSSEAARLCPADVLHVCNEVAVCFSLRTIGQRFQ